MNTVLITGCSSGYGLETARYFLGRDWNVVATMREPREDVLPASPRLRVFALDVTDSKSIARTIEAAGSIDVLVNNAGIGLISALESTSIETVRNLFETHTFGAMALTQAFLPQFANVRVVSSSTSRRPSRCVPFRAHGEQGRDQRVYRIARARTRPLQHSRMHRAAGPFFRNAL